MESNGYVELALPLTNSRGNSKCLRFNYWATEDQQMPLVVSPHILGMSNPYFTRQAIYFLSDVESVIRLMVPAPNDTSNYREWSQSQLANLRAMADNCLFEYSLVDSTSRLTTRSDRPAQVHMTEHTVSSRFPESDHPTASYFMTDGGKAGLLEPEGVQSFDQLYTEYVHAVYSQEIYYLGGTKIYSIWTDELSESDDPHVIFEEMPYTFEELYNISRIIPINSDLFPRDGESITEQEAPLKLREFFIATLNQPYLNFINSNSLAKYPEYQFFDVNRMYNPLLLDFYFAGLRSLSPINEFRSYYSVVEYMFDESAGAYDSDQIRDVVCTFVRPERIISFLSELDTDAQQHFSTYTQHVGQYACKRLDTYTSNIQRAVANRIYQFRNAIFHSKKSRHGRANSNFRPSTKEEVQVIQYEAQLVKMVAQEIIKQVGVDA